MTIKKIIALACAALLLVGVFAISGCGKKEEKAESPAQGDSAQDSAPDAASSANPTAVITVREYGTITLELDPVNAPNTTANFISLANKGFYDGLTFHRIIKDFMIQGGCPKGDGTGGPGYSIKGEFSANGVKNDIKHVRGTISMGRTSFDMDSAGSQFFICQRDYEFGDGQYAAFGHVTDGIEVVDKIASVATGANDRPLNDVIIDSITVDTHGVSYPEPEKVS